MESETRNVLPTAGVLEIANNMSSRRFSYLIEVGSGHYNIRGSLVMGCIADIGSQMSLLRLKSGRFLVVDAIHLEPEVKREIDLLTDNGALMEACVATHPFHTLFFPAFHELYPKCKLYGTPRHIRRLQELPWEPQTVDMCLGCWAKEGVEMRIPAGADFVDPHEDNHFAGVFVFHLESKSLFNDDTLMFYSWDHPGRIINCILPCIGNTLTLHPTLMDGDSNTGLQTKPSAVRDFRVFFEGVLREWDFDIICTAHTGIKVGGAKALATEMWRQYDPSLRALEKQFCQSNVSVPSVYCCLCSITNLQRKNECG